MFSTIDTATIKIVPGSVCHIVQVTYACTWAATSPYTYYFMQAYYYAYLVYHAC